MNILIACSEAIPYAKTGGLADVTGSLLMEFRRRRQQASLVLPLYASVRGKFRLKRTGKSVSVPVGNSLFEGEIFSAGSGRTPDAYFIECDRFFGRPEFYGTASGDYSDNALRFIFFSRAVLEACIALNLRPDIIHCNDWQTGMIPLYIRTLYRKHEQFGKTATLFTVHNLGYQGNCAAANMAFTGLGPDYFTPERLEFYGSLSPMKAGLLYADLLNTVSKTYAQEILEPENGFGMDGVLRKRSADLFGIINGIDDREWDPVNDKYIPSGFSAENLKGKALCRDRLMRLAGLTDREAPLIGIVSRLSRQKGLDLLLEAMDGLVSLGAQIIILGKGEEIYQRALSEKAVKHNGKVYVHIGFEEPFAHLIYAGSDFFLMPSLYEPCGIGQLIAMRYGSIPVARRTGGLADTVDDFDHLSGRGTGFLFSEYSSGALTDAVKRAFCVYTDHRKMQAMVCRAMGQDFSWRRASGEYLDLYCRTMDKRTS